MKNKTLWLTRTAILLALLLVLQFATKPLGQFVTGSCVNLVLAVAALCVGLWSGLLIAVVSPFLAFMLQIAPMPITLVPGVAVGNAVLVLVLALAAKALLKKSGSRAVIGRYGLAAGAAVVKFAVLWLVITRLLIPLAGLPEQKAAALTATFTWPQLITALIGSLIAMTIAPTLSKAMSGKN